MTQSASRQTYFHSHSHWSVGGSCRVCSRGGSRAEVWSFIGPGMFVSDESESQFSIFSAVLSYEVFGDIGVHIRDGDHVEIDRHTRPVIAIAVEGEEESAVGEGRTMGELLAPPSEPPGDEVEGVLGWGVAAAQGIQGLVYHLCPNEGVEAVALRFRMMWVLLLASKVEEGRVSIDNVVGEPCLGGKASEGGDRDRGTVAGV